MLKEFFAHLSLPLEKEKARECTSKIASLKPLTAYEAVEFFRENFLAKCEFKESIPAETIPLASLVSLHNAEGIRPKTISSMVKDIRLGKEIFHENGLPNIKVARSSLDELVLFDGHHSILSYMKCGRSFLHEVPYLFLELQEHKGFPEEEFLVFFGKHAPKLKEKNWRSFALNWQAPEKKQLCHRKQKNLGELFESLKPGPCFPVQ